MLRSRSRLGKSHRSLPRKVRTLIGEVLAIITDLEVLLLHVALFVILLLEVWRYLSSLTQGGTF